jgi:hypothetical protein
VSALEVSKDTLKAANGNLPAGGMRRLLNTEKLIFTAPANLEAFYSSTLVQVTAQAEGESWDPAYVPEPVKFNIVVTENLLGLPLNCVPHVITVVVLVAWIVWAVFSKTPKWPASILLQIPEASDQEQLKTN